MSNADAQTGSTRTVPRITYVIPAFNAARTLPATLASLTAQSERGWEAVVVDDGSADGTADAALGLGDPRIRVLSRANAGPAASREAGVAAARADCITFLDADDTLEPDHARVMLDALGDRDAVACGLVSVDGAGGALEWTHTPEARDTQPERLLECNRFQVATVVLRRRVLEAVRAHHGSLFDPSLGCEDWEFWMRVCAPGVGTRWAEPVTRPLVRYTRAAQTRSRALLSNYVGARVAIARHARSPVEAAHYLRRQAVRVLGQAVASRDAHLVARTLSDAGVLTPADDDLLAAAVRWGLTMDRLMPASDWRALAQAAHEALADMLPAFDRARLVAFRAALAGDAWREVAARARGATAPHETLVVYGLGRNGAAVARHLLTMPGRVAFVDDDPAREPGLARVRLDDLTVHHRVLVTPFDREAMVARLADRPVGGVLLPELLLLAS